MEILEERKYVIYKHTSPNKKSYIGLTKDYNNRCSNHRKSNYCRLFHRAINKYGWDNFTHEILEENLTLEEANTKEKYYVKYYNSLTPNGYNLTTGGDSYKISEETKLKHRWKYRGNKTGYSNIYKSGNNYKVSFIIDGVIQKLGTYSTLEDAVEARDNRTETSKALVFTSKTNITGVYLRENGHYEVRITENGKSIGLGTYNTLEDAVEAKNLQTRTNKANNIEESKIGETGIQLLRGFYVVIIKIKGKKINLGHYNNLEDAIEARDNKSKTSKANDRKKSKLGVEGINLVGNSYRVIIKVNGETLRLGMYSTLEDALEAKSLKRRTDRAKVGSHTKRTQQSIEHL